MQVTRKLKGFLAKLGVRVVLDSRFGGDLTLIEAATEFLERFKHKEHLPMLASSCPGWVCYAEKRHGEFVLP